MSGTVIQEFHVLVRLLCRGECTLGRSALTVIRFQSARTACSRAKGFLHEIKSMRVMQSIYKDTTSC